jgi:hypothetical protein
VKNTTLFAFIFFFLAACDSGKTLKKEDKVNPDPPMPIATSGPYADDNNLDQDINTDNFLLAAWMSLSGNWPNVSLPSVLMELTFNIVNKSVVLSPINILSTSHAAGFKFDGQDHLLSLDGTSYINVPILALDTQHVYISSYFLSSDGSKVIVQISYNADNSALTGLGLRIHYDNRVLQLYDVTYVLASGLFIQPTATVGGSG